MSKSPAKRIPHLEDVCMGAGFLLQKLQHLYGADFGEGLRIQVRDCINDCRQITSARMQRDAAKSTGDAA